VSAANAALRGVLHADMKELLHDNFAAVTGSCKAVRDQLCNVEGVDYSCSNAYGIQSTCQADTLSNDVWGSYCRETTADETSAKEEIDFVEEATAEDCKVLGEGAGCVAEWAGVGLKCKTGLACFGYTESTTVGQPNQLGTCEVPGTRTADPTPAVSTQCTNYFQHQYICDDTADCTPPNGCHVTCNDNICKSTTEEEEGEEFTNIKELLEEFVTAN
jgi:hypothetical protein